MFVWQQHGCYILPKKERTYGIETGQIIRTWSDKCSGPIQSDVDSKEKIYNNAMGKAFLGFLIFMVHHGAQTDY